MSLKFKVIPVTEQIKHHRVLKTNYFPRPHFLPPSSRDSSSRFIAARFVSPSESRSSDIARANPNPCCKVSQDQALLGNFEHIPGAKIPNPSVRYQTATTQKNRFFCQHGSRQLKSMVCKRRQTYPDGKRRPLDAKRRPLDAKRRPLFLVKTPDGKGRPLDGKRRPLDAKRRPLFSVVFWGQPFRSFIWPVHPLLEVVAPIPSGWTISYFLGDTPQLARAWHRATCRHTAS